MTQDIVLYNR